MREAATAERAMVWMRLSVRQLVSGFAPDDRARAYRWLEYGQWEAVYRLRAGEPYLFAARFGESALTWTARPVLFVSLVDRARWHEARTPRAGRNPEDVTPRPLPAPRPTTTHHEQSLGDGGHRPEAWPQPTRS